MRVMESPPHEAGGVTLPQPLKFRLPVYVPAQADVGVDDDLETPLQPMHSASMSNIKAGFI